MQVFDGSVPIIYKICKEQMDVRLKRARSRGCDPVVPTAATFETTFEDDDMPILLSAYRVHSSNRPSPDLRSTNPSKTRLTMWLLLLLVIAIMAIILLTALLKRKKENPA